MSTENITDHGATPDDGTDDTAAISSAMEAAGAGGTVYVPTGTYLIGDGSVLNDPLQSGSNQPPGISFYGDGPGESVIKWKDSSSSTYQRGIRWNSGYDHGNVTVEDMTWDGNWQNQSEGSGFGFVFEGTGSTNLTMTNVEWLNWWTIGGRTVKSSKFSYCTFRNCGMGADTTGSDGHGFNHSSTEDVTAEWCLFERISGVAIDHTDNATGDLYMTDCYVQDIGAGLVKNNPNTGTKYLTRVDSRNANGQWIIDNSVNELSTRAFYNVPPHTSAGDYVVDNVIFGNSTWPAILVEHSFDVSGDKFVIDNVNTDNDQPAAWHSNDGGNIDINRISIVNTAFGSCFDLDGGATGSITELNRSNNPGGLGDLDNVTIGTDNSGSVAHDVTVPTKKETGAGATTTQPTVQSITSPVSVSGSVLALSGSVYASTGTREIIVGFNSSSVPSTLSGDDGATTMTTISYEGTYALSGTGFNNDYFLPVSGIGEEGITYTCAIAHDPNSSNPRQVHFGVGSDHLTGYKVRIDPSQGTLDAGRYTGRETFTSDGSDTFTGVSGITYLIAELDLNASNEVVARVRDSPGGTILAEITGSRDGAVSLDGFLLGHQGTSGYHDSIAKVTR